ncbi:unnamed protein product, partial [Discosporangium mesarthrocarpum]
GLGLGLASGSGVGSERGGGAAFTTGSSSGSGSSGRTSGGSGGRLLMVVNCHLTGGPAPDRRLRQVVDALDAARKGATKVIGTPDAAATASGAGG